MKKHSTSDRLKQIMSERGLKQVDILNLAKPFCEKYNVTFGKSSLNQYISGYAEPGQHKLFILALTLNVSEAWLMGYDVPMEREGTLRSAEDSTTKNQDEIKRNVAQNICHYRKKAGLTQKQLAELLGVRNTAVSNWENGQNSIDTELLFRLCKIFNITLNEIYGIDDTKKETPEEDLYEKLGITPVSKKKIPLLGNVACGEPCYADQSVEAFISVDEGLEADFCLRAKGDSMINARIFNGDVLFVKKQAMVDDGDIALVIVEDEATVKRVYYDRENNILQLVPDNPKYKTMRYVGAELNKIHILGKIVAGQYKI